MQHALLYVLAFALGGLQLTPTQLRFHCQTPGQRDLVGCCCDGAQAETHYSHGSSAVVCGSGKQEKGRTSNPPCDRESPDDDRVVAVSVCCEITHVAAITPTMVDTSRKSRDLESAVCGQPIVIPAAPYGDRHGDQVTTAILARHRNGPPGVAPPRFILHCSFLI